MKREPLPHLYCLHVFGCQMNKLDAELVEGVLRESGYEAAEDPEAAGIRLFVTCSVRDHAEARVHSRLGALCAWKRRCPEGIIGVLGCMAQKEGRALLDRHPHVDLVIGTRDFHRLDALLRRVSDGERGIVAVGGEEPPRVRRRVAVRPRPFQAYVAIMRGCDSFCSYCVVPYVRGREVSRPLEAVVEEASRLVEDGVKEITLLGQTVNRYRDPGGRSLPDLLYRLQAMDGLERIGIVTSYCAYVDPPLIEAMAACTKVARYLHLPAQSGSDRILARMGRRYTADRYREVAAELRAAMPDLEIGSDFIVGFPGEREEDFRATERLMEEVRFQQSFVFKYSPRPGTRAAERFPDDVSAPVKEARNARLLEVQHRIAAEKNARLEGETVEVLVEGPSRRNPERYTGRTAYNQIAVFPPCPGLEGSRMKVRVARSTALTLLCEEIVEVET